MVITKSGGEPGTCPKAQGKHCFHKNTEEEDAQQCSVLEVIKGEENGNRTTEFGGESSLVESIVRKCCCGNQMKLQKTHWKVSERSGRKSYPRNEQCL